MNFIMILRTLAVCLYTCIMKSSRIKVFTIGYGHFNLLLDVCVIGLSCYSIQSRADWGA